MARKSRKLTNKTITQTVEHVKSRAGIYGRLSVEDNGYKTKDSIKNQILYLNEFIERNEAEIQLVDTYIDNGTTGTNFERAEWNRLIGDIKNGIIDCIIVKDFSRIGRNYIEVGNYLEKIFPFLGVRVIAVNENFDSNKQEFENRMLMNSLTNIVNDYYARDISRKITQTKRTMQKKGEYASGVLPYGYKKNDGGKKFIVDPESACVVKKIFEWRVQGKGCLCIANYLNELAIPSPGMYRYMNGNQSFKRSKDVKWKTKHVAGILTNPTYLGHMVQGKTRCSYFEQNGKLRFLPKEDWILVENTHEPLVTQEQFDIAADMAEKSRIHHDSCIKANADVPHIDNPLRKKIYCGQCGGLMTRRSRVKNGVRNYCYFCSFPRMKHGVSCTNTHIHEIPLLEALRSAADQQLQLIGVLENQWNIKQQTGALMKESREYSSQINELNEKLKWLKAQKLELYTDMKDKILLTADYECEKQRIEREMEACEKKIKYIKENECIKQEIKKTLDEHRGSVMAMPQNEIPLDMLDKLIEKIIVYSPEHIEVTFSFADKIKTWLERGEKVEGWLSCNIS